MKTSVLVTVPNAEEEFHLEFPMSRVKRDFLKLNVSNSLEGFDGHVQVVYNESPVGPYQGPYDQNEILSLDVQLPESDLDFDKYTEFRHSDALSCRKFTIGESYRDIDDLSKIDSIVVDDDDTDDESDSNDDDDVHHHTCQYGNCVVPCPCFPCCTGEKQCTEHKITHNEMFIENMHAVTIRSTEEFCNDESFIKKSYLIKHPGIPLDCTLCKRDFLHHICYHLDLHESCKFCRQNKFKTFAETATELESAVKKHESFLKTVCPHCNKKFCDPYFKRKHLEFEHGDAAPFICDHCVKKFHSKQAKEYHDKVYHTSNQEKEKCLVCEKTFAAKVSLLNHMKYVHSEERCHQCPLCESKFKQKKDRTVHILNVHGVDTSKAMLGNEEEFEEHKCSVCDARFKYKKDLNSHVKLKHDKESKAKKFQCDQCTSIFPEKKSLNAHKKMKHADKAIEFSCPICGKTFNQKNNMKRHQQTHK